MTVRHFDGVDDIITMPPLSPPFTGFGTLAVIWRASDGGNHGIMSGDASGFERWGHIAVAGDETYVDYNGFSALHSWTADEWYLSLITKADGTSTVRNHSMPYSTGVWNHTDRSSVTVEAAGGSTATHFGYGVNTAFRLEGELAVAAVWIGDVLTDGECESLETELSNWLTLNPSACWAFNQDSVVDPVLDLTENGYDQSAITGTSVLTGDDPPGFNFSLTEDTRFYRQGGVWVPVTRHVRQGGAWIPV